MSGAGAAFSVQTHLTPAGVEGEVRQGIAVAEAAKAVGVAQVVYSSVDGELRAISEDVALMWEWIDDFGYDRADIAALRERHTALRTLPGWLEETGWRVAVAA